MRIHPGGFRLVLAGPKVARLLPYLQQKGFIAEAFTKGSEALNRMRQAPCHLLLHELECGDTMGIDLARGAKQEGITAAALLVDDPMKSGMIISALARGVDAYVAIPPDETIFFARIESMLLAQWGLVVTQQQAQLTEEITRLQQVVASAEGDKAAVEKKLRDRIADLEKQIATEKKRVADLDREAGVLREQLTTMHLVTGAKTGLSDEGAAVRGGHGDDEQVDFLLDDEPLPKKAPPKATPAKAPPAKAPPPPRVTVTDDKHTMAMTAEAARALVAESAPAKKPPAPAPADLDLDDDFATIVKAKPPTAPGMGPLSMTGGPPTSVTVTQPAPRPSIPPSPRPSPIDAFDESTQDIPAGIAAAVIGKKPAPSVEPARRPAPTMPSMPALGPLDTGLDELAHFDPGGVPDEEPPEFTMAMPSDVARSLLEQSVKNQKPIVDDVHTMAMSADVARSLVAETAQKKAPARTPAPLSDELPTLATPEKWAGDHTEDFDVPTAAVQLNKPGMPPPRMGPPMGGKPAPKSAPKPMDDDFFDEPTPAAGTGKAPAVPPMPRSVGVKGPGGQGFDAGRRGGKPAGLDSQVVRDLAGIPSLDNEEVLFVDDD